MLLLQVTHGPVYVIRLAGQIAVPALQMSFSTYDFGYCFVYQAGMSAKTAQLKLTNADDKDLMYASLQYRALRIIVLPRVLLCSVWLDILIRCCTMPTRCRWFSGRVLDS